MALALLVVGSIKAEAQLTDSCLVDAGAVYQKIDGFGASSAYVTNWTSAWADMFFSTNTGVGLSLLRSRVAPDGSVPDANLMQFAQARGARVWASPFTPPAMDKDSGNLTSGNFLSASNQPYANFLGNYVANVKANYGVNLYAISVQNEPDFGTAPNYESCTWSGQQIHDFVPYLSQALANDGVGSTKIMAADEAYWLFDLVSNTLADPVTAADLGIVSAHDYNFSDATVNTAGKPLWQTEASTLTGGFDGSMPEAINWATQIYAMLAVAQASAYNFFWLTPIGDDQQGLTDQYGHPAKRLYVFGQYSKFVRPGFFRIGATNSVVTFISAFKDPVSGNFAIVADNFNQGTVGETITLTNFNAGLVTPWITSPTLSLAQQPAVAVTNGVFSYVLPAQSVVTFTGGTNFSAAIVSQPQGQTVIPGRTVPFTVGASGVTPIYYQWQTNGVAISGATNLAYTVTNALVGQSGEQFRCVVSNAVGVVTSAVATLTVAAPTCVEPLAGTVSWWQVEGTNAVDIFGGNNGILLGTATVTNSPVGNGVLLDGNTGYVQMPHNLFAGANTAALSLELWFETTNGGVIMGEQTGSVFGSAGSWVPHIYVGTNGLLYVQMYWPGNFDQLVTTTQVNDGVYHHMVVTFDGANENLYLDGALAGIIRLQSSDFTANYLCQLGTGYTAGWPAGNGGWYSFQGVIAQPTLYTNTLTAAQVQTLYLTGSAGKCTDQLMTIIVSEPSNEVVQVGGTGTLSVSATSGLPLNYQWYAGGVPISGATNSSLSVTHLLSVNPTSYSVVITSYYGSVTSSVATLSVAQPTCVEPPAGIEAWWQGQGTNLIDILAGNNGILLGGATEVTNTVVGDGVAYNGATSYAQLPPNLFSTTGALSFEVWFQTTNSGVILAEQNTNAFAGTVSSYVPSIYVGANGDLYVQMFWPGYFNQIITSTPVNDGLFHHLVVACDGANEVLYLDGAAVTSTPLPSTSFTAGFSCQLGAGYTAGWPGGNGGWLAFKGVLVQPALYTNALTAGQVLTLYHAGSAGKCTDELAPLITGEPTNTLVQSGTTGILSVSATSFLPLSYQWYVNGVALGGATNASFTVSHLFSVMPTNYTVVIASHYGIVTSTVASLAVTPPNCVEPAAGIVAWWEGVGTNFVDILAGNNGVLVGGATNIATVVGNGLTLNGTTAYAQMPKNLFSNQGALSLELWFETTNGGVILAEQNTNAFAGTVVSYVPHIYVGTNGLLYVQMYWDGNFNQISTSVAVDDGYFHHLAVTCDGTTEIVYLDGAVVGSTPLPASNFTANYSCQLGLGYTGGWPGGANGWYPFNGYIVQPALYTNTLTAGQVQALYHAGSADKCTDELAAMIVSGPSNEMVSVGGTGVLSVNATSILPLNYQWYANGVAIGGATNASLSVYHLYSVIPTNYSVVVASHYGSETSTLASLSVTPPNCTEPAVGITSWWQAEGTNLVDILAADNGLLQGGVAVITNTVVGNGMGLNGGTAYVQMPENLFSYQNAGPLSFELWFETSSGGVILAEQPTSAFATISGGWIPHIYVGTNGLLYAQMFWNNFFQQASSSVAVNDGYFHHLVVTFDGSTEILYLDGVMVGSTPQSPSNYTANFFCQLGVGYTSGWPGGFNGWYPFNGILAQPTLYRTNLTATQVVALYHAGSAGKCTDELQPVIISEPTNQAVAVAGTGTLNVGAMSILSLSYQWYGEGVAISGATNTSLSVSNWLSATPTNYTVVVATSFGSVTSTVATLSLVPTSCVEPAAGIEAWWLAGSNAVDVIGGHNGALMAGATSTETLVGDGFSFNGGGGYVQLPQNLIPPTNAVPFSLELWFETASGGVILGEQTGLPTGGPGAGWLPEIYVGADGHLYVQMFWDGGFNQIRTSTQVNNGSFHHLAMTYDGSNEKVYLDGSLVGNGALGYSTYAAGFNSQFGNGYTQNWPEGNGGWFPFNGIIDAPTLYTNTLTATQVQALYNAAGVGKCTSVLLPMITSEPTNVIFAPGGTAVFSVSAVSLLPMTYQWLAGSTAINAATNTSLTLVNTTTNDEGYYSVAISTSYGSVTSTVVTLGSPPTNNPVVNAGPFSVQPALLTNGLLQLTATNYPGVVFRVLGSTNLLSWQTIATVTNVTGTVQFTDPASTNFSQRFYRMVSP